MVARWLGVATPEPAGFPRRRATPWVRELARILSEEEIRVVLVDSNWANVTAARRMGLQTHYGNVLSETAEDEIDLHGIGRLLALTPNDEVMC